MMFRKLRKLLFGNARESRPQYDSCIVDIFSEEYGATVRSCLDCNALVAGGPTRCGFCASKK